MESVQGKSFVEQVKELRRFCDGERIPNYHLHRRTRYVKRDLALAERWLECWGLEQEIVVLGGMEDTLE